MKSEVNEMQEVRNAHGKLACKMDKNERIVEIVQKGCKTVIRFKPDGTVEILNTET